MCCGVALTNADERLQLRTEFFVVSKHPLVLLLVVEVRTLYITDTAFFLCCVLAKSIDYLCFLSLFEFFDDASEAISTRFLLSFSRTTSG